MRIWPNEPKLERNTEHNAIEPRPGLKRLWIRWFNSRIMKVHEHDSLFWRLALIGVWITCMSMMSLTSLGMPSGFGVRFDTHLFVFVGTLGMVLSTCILACVLSLFRVPVPRIFTGSLIYTGLVVFVIFKYAEFGLPLSLMFALAAGVVGMAAGCLIGLAASRAGTRRLRQSTFRIFTAGCLLLILLATGGWLDSSPLTSHLSPAVPSSGKPVQVDYANPAEPGHFAYYDFTYGSGQNRYHLDFSGSYDLLSSPVDASAFVRNWSGLRTFYWGFNERALPVKGHVWMPEGNGPFPLVLMVHGNHLMEQPSDTGYTYLGELLASRGFIAVSVDENFLNYSVWTGIPDDDFKVRAWMLLRHLEQISVFHQKEGNPFSGRVDLGNVALLGHSRGGQAAAMAADAENWFTQENLDGIEIKSVIAIAPTDKSIEGKKTTLHNVHYLTLHGANDGDVTNFSGERQYERTHFDGTVDRFKASLYIEGANHSQFNTGWGIYDRSFPGGLFLSRTDILAGADQREIAKGYVSAFLEATLHDASEYRDLFRDERTGSAWLPETRYFSRFESSDFVSVARFDEDRQKNSLLDGAEAEESNLAAWREEKAKDRDGNDKGTNAALLEWQEQSAFTLDLQGWRQEVEDSETMLSFDLADLGADLMRDREEPVETPQIVVELESEKGVEVSLPLEQFREVQASPSTTYTISPVLEHRIDNGKYRNDTEVVYQTFLLPFRAFEEQNADFDPEQLSRITFHFVNDQGKIMLDNIGFEPEFDGANM